MQKTTYILFAAIIIPVSSTKVELITLPPEKILYTLLLNGIIPGNMNPR